MNKHYLFVVMLLSYVFYASPVVSARTVLQPLNNLVLADFINLSDLLLEQEKYGTIIRVYRIGEGPYECDGRPETCPRYRLYIGILLNPSSQASTLKIIKKSKNRLLKYKKWPLTP